MKKGFTLIELLVVVLIIGILSAIALPQYTVAVEKARVAEVMSNVATIKQQIDLYIMENGLPSSGSVSYKDIASVDLSGGTWESSQCYATKYFTYCIRFLSTGVEIETTPNADLYYDFYATTNPNNYNNDSPVGNWYQSCVTESTDLGRKICKQYESVGWKYADADL